jgi:hypothetical protein
VCWVGTDRRVYRTHPNPVRISDEAIEQKLHLDRLAHRQHQNPWA